MKKNTCSMLFHRFIFLRILLLVQISAPAQVKNYGNMHVFPTAHVNLNTVFTNSSSASYENDGTVFLAGDFTNDQPSITPGLGTTELNGTSLQNINGAKPMAFYKLVVNNDAEAIDLLSNISVKKSLVFVKGKIRTNAFKVIVPANASVLSAGSATGWIIGNLQKHLTTGSDIPVVFEIGDDKNYTPASVIFDEVTTAGNLLASVSGTEHVNIASSSIIPGNTVNRFWSFTNTSIDFSSASLTLNWVHNDVDTGANPDRFGLAEYQNALWSLYAADSAASTSIKVNALTSFGDFIVGESSCSTPAKPASLTQGPQFNLCGGGDFIYGVAPVPGASSYTWILPAGFSLLSQPGNTVTIHEPASFMKERLYVTANNNCGRSSTKMVKLFGTPAPPVIAGPSSVRGQQTGIVYSVTNAEPGIAYTWDVPGRAKIVSGQGTNSITVKWDNKSGSIGCTAINGCGSSPKKNYSVMVCTVPAKPEISGPLTVSGQQTGLVYTVTNAEAGTSYTWSVPVSAQILSGQGTSGIIVKWSNKSGNVACTAGNSCGNSQKTTYYVTVTSPIANSKIGETGAQQNEVPVILKVSPNPARANTVVLFTVHRAGRYAIELSDVQGKILVAHEINAVEGTNRVYLDLSGYANSTYFVSLIFGTERKTVKLIKERY